MVQDSCFKNRTHFRVRGEKTLFVVCNGKANTSVHREAAFESSVAFCDVEELLVCENRRQRAPLLLVQALRLAAA